MPHATNPVRLLVAERAQLARMPALIIVVYAAAVYLLFLAVLSCSRPPRPGFILAGIAFEERDLKKTTGSRRHE
jgi:protein-S-isoprenylcysteine O-methyltransferase Ste14